MDLEEVKRILKKNSYPDFLIEKTIKNFLDVKFSNEKHQKVRKENIYYFKLPFLGKQSDNLKKKISNIAKHFCKNSNPTLIFTSTKIQDYFTAKDSTPLELKSNLVYKFQCAGCNSCYIGETTRHLKTRIDEHLRKDKSSHIYKHLANNISCFDNSNERCFSILDTASTHFQLKLKEGLYINWENPDLNRQVKSVSSTLTL